MHRAPPREDNQQSAEDRGADASAPRSTPLTMVSGAVAGDDLQSVAISAADAIGRPVVIAIPALGEPVLGPPESVTRADVQLIIEHADSAIRGATPKDGTSDSLADAVPVRIGREVVGVVAAAAGDSGGEITSSEHRAWLEGAAAAAAVTALMSEVRDGDLRGSRRALLQAIGAGPPADVGALVDHARRLGIDLSAGAIAICGQPAEGQHAQPLDDLVSRDGLLLAEMDDGRVLGLVPIASTPLPAERAAAALASTLAAQGMQVASSAPRREPSALHEALREAELLLELAAAPDGSASGQEETYRLLIGVLLRDPEELELLRARTISPLIKYDAEHETELVATLQGFLVHHGSTTETAEAMSLHRHTVGYRLARVHEVSGLSPYESDGRERLSLGLKADQILAADRRRTQHE